MKNLGSVLLALLFVVAAASAAHAQSHVSSRRMGVRWDGRVPSVYFSARDLATADVRHKLSSGLPQNIVLRVYAYTRHGRTPIAVTARSCRVIYDLWDEVYRVQVQSVNGTRAESYSSVDAVLSRCLVVRNVPVGRQSDYAPRSGQDVYFAVLVEFNPLSPQTVQRIRRWLARGGGRFDNDAFFGSFVSIFVNRRIGDAERTLRFRSQPVGVP